MVEGRQSDCPPSASFLAKCSSGANGTAGLPADCGIAEEAVVLAACVAWLGLFHDHERTSMSMTRARISRTSKETVILILVNRASPFLLVIVFLYAVAISNLQLSLLLSEGTTPRILSPWPRPTGSS